MKNLLLNYDDQVAQWAFNTFNYAPTKYDMAIGIVENDRIVGAALYHAWNGPDVEISYYGPQTMTLGIIKALARVAVNHLGVSRITARTAKSNKAITRGIKGLGFEYEGIRHNAYGGADAVMYGLYGRNLARLAGRTLQ